MLDMDCEVSVFHSYHESNFYVNALANTIREVTFSMGKASFFPPWESWVYTIRL